MRTAPSSQTRWQRRGACGLNRTRSWRPRAATARANLRSVARMLHRCCRAAMIGARSAATASSALYETGCRPNCSTTPSPEAHEVSRAGATPQQPSWQTTPPHSSGSAGADRRQVENTLPARWTAATRPAGILPPAKGVRTPAPCAQADTVPLSMAAALARAGARAIRSPAHESSSSQRLSASGRSIEPVTMLRLHCRVRSYSPY